MGFNPSSYVIGRFPKVLKRFKKTGFFHASLVKAMYAVEVAGDRYGTCTEQIRLEVAAQRLEG